MIDWLFQNTIDTSILLVLVLIFRNPVRRIFGAHIAYSLWALPILKLFITIKFNRPDVMTKLIEIPNSKELLPVYSGPLQADQNIMKILFLTWFVGLFTWTVFKIINTYKFRNLINENTEVKMSSLHDLRTKWVELKHSSRIKSPLITGLFKPTIFLPTSFEQTYSSKQQKLILKHEMTHAKRLDLWALVLAEVFRAIFWFNPLVHIGFNKFQQDQEFACDRQVLKNADQDTRIIYGTALKQSLSAVLTPQSLTFFFHKHERFIMLTKHKTNKLLSITGLLFGIAIAYPVFTQTNVTMTEKSEVTEKGIVSFEFNDIPLTTVVWLVSDAAGGVKNMQGLELLEGINITVSAKNVYALDFIDSLLKDNELKVFRIGNTWQFSIL